MALLDWSHKYPSLEFFRDEDGQALEKRPQSVGYLFRIEEEPVLRAQAIALSNVLNVCNPELRRKAIYTDRMPVLLIFAKRKEDDQACALYTCA